MGYIYKLTAPNGKSYIGQTVQNIKIRWLQHKIASKKAPETKGCRALNYAIRKYGWHNFTKEVLCECSGPELDKYEKEFIQKFNTYPPPNGYNLTSGGSGAYVKKIREKRAVSNKKEQNKDLPMYVKIRRTPYSVGYIVEKPGFKASQFCSPRMTMDQKLKLAISYLEKINNNIEDKTDLKRRNDTNLDMPKFVSYLKRNDGFRVKIPGKKIGYFCSKYDTREQKYQKALKYLEEIKSKDAQRLNDSGSQNKDSQDIVYPH